MIHPLRSTFRLFILVALLTTFASSIFAQDQVADSESVLKLDAGLGFSDHMSEVKSDHWYPLRVTIKAIRADVEGTALVQQEDNPMVISIPIAIAKGTTKRYEVPFRPINTYNSQAPIKVTLDAGRLGEDSLLLPLQFLEPDDRSVLVVADDPVGFAFFSIRFRGESQISGYLPEQSLVYGTPEHLPEDPVLLEALTLVVISTSQLREIRPAQWKALLAWTELGGRLLIAVGQHQQFYTQSHLPKLLDFPFAPPKPLPFDSPNSAHEQFEVLHAAPEFELSANTRTLFSLADQPVIFGSPRGRGWLGFSTVALDRPVIDAINARPGGPAVWTELAGQGPPRTPALDLARLNEGAINGLLQLPFATSLAGIAWVLTFVGLYILLAAPINWIIWSRLKRREWAWPTALVLALGFAWYAYSTGVSRAGDKSQLSRVTILSRPADSSFVRKTSLGVIYTPRRMREELTIGGSNGLPAPLRDFVNPYDYGRQGTDPYQSQPLVLSGPIPLKLVDFVVYPSSARGLRSDAILQTSGSITLLTPPEFRSDSPLRISGGSLRNDTPYTFDGWMIHYNQETWMGRDPILPGTSFGLSDLVPAYLRKRNANSFDYFEALKTATRPKAVLNQQPSAQSENIEQYLSMVQYSWQVSDMNQYSDPNQFRFVSFARREADPDPADIPTDKLQEVIVYEQDFPLTPDSATVPLSSAPSLDPGWALELATELPDYSRFGYFPLSNDRNNAQRTTDSLVLEPGEYVLLVRPLGKLDPFEIKSVEITLRLDPYPLSSNATTFPVNGATTNPAQPILTPESMPWGDSMYQLVGCPFEYYDFDSEKWVESGDFISVPFILDGKASIFDPVTNSILLRFHAALDDHVFAKLDDQHRRGEIVAGKNLWSNSMAIRWIQFGDLKVRVIPKSASEPASQEAAP